MSRKESDLEKENSLASHEMNQDELEAWIYQGITVPRRSRKNIFKKGAPLEGAYSQWVEAGGLELMEYRELNQKKAERLEYLTPEYPYQEVSDWSLDSLHGKKLLVAQYGHSDNYCLLEDLFKEYGLKKYTLELHVSDASGAGFSSGDITLNLWLKPGDESREIFATDYYESSTSVRTGDILGGPNSMWSESEFGRRDVKVKPELLGEMHLAFISTHPIARAIRKISK